MRKLTLLLLFVFFAPLHAGIEEEIIVGFRGDINGDSQVNISDVIYLNNYLFVNGPSPPCFDAADVNNSGTVNITDSILLMEHLFNGCGPCLADPREIICPK